MTAADLLRLLTAGHPITKHRGRWYITGLRVTAEVVAELERQGTIRPHRAGPVPMYVVKEGR